MEKKVVIIGGPTASGKSALALSLAERFPLEIVNFDSLQIYRYMDIGTAKPTRGVRSSFPHHLYDIRNPDEAFSAAEYVREASESVREIHERGKIPLFVGGTGLYIRSFLRGLDALPSSDSVRADLLIRAEREGLENLYQEVKAKDPEFARSVSPSDRIRIIRALEVMMISGNRYSSQRNTWRKRDKKFVDLFLVLSPERVWLYERINMRVEKMFADGFVEEVKILLEMGYSSELRPMRALGYRQIIELLRGERDLTQTMETIKRHTRHYAKRQLTWFRKEDAQWVEPLEEQKISKLVETFLI